MGDGRVWRSAAWALALLLGGASARADPGVRVGHVGPEGSPWDVAMRAFAERLRPLVAPRAVKVFAGAMQGDEEAHLAKCRDGRLEVCGLSDLAASRTIPELGVFAMPFLFRSDAEVEHAVDALLLRRLRPVFWRNGLYLFGFTAVGWVDIATRERPANPANLAGLSIRVPGSPLYGRLATALGAKPQFVSIHEADLALQTGVVGGLFHTQVFLFGSGWYTNLRHILEARLAFSVAMIVVNRPFWEALSPAARKQVEAYERELARTSWREYRALVPKMREALIAAGVVIASPSDGEAEELRRKLDRSRLKAALGPSGAALVSEVEALLERYRKRAP